MRWAGRSAFASGPRPKALPPWLFWKVLQSLYKTFADRKERERAMQHLIPRMNPGAGLLYGRENIAKALTYRATYVPGGFNRERDARRAARTDADNQAYVESRTGI